MRLNHLNIVVDDPAGMHDFLVDVFEFESLGEGSRTMQGVRDETGATLVLMRSKGGAVPDYPPGFHIGFVQPGRADVDRLRARLIDRGYEIDDPASARGGYQFYFTGPSEVMIEVSC